MPRYEFVQGTSSKFWEIELNGASFTTTYGKIGTDGKSTTKDWPDEEKAQKEYDKVVKSKTKKGYILVGGGGSAPAAKAAPAKKATKAAPAKKAAAAAAPAGGKQRYEFEQGTSSKFWEIELSGTSFTTTYGKIGTDGKSTSKDFDSEEKALKEYEKAIASKTKKGYAPVDGGGGAAAPAAAADGGGAKERIAGLEKESWGDSKKFIFRRVVDYKSKTGLTQAAKGAAYRVGFSWDGDDEPGDIEAFVELLGKLVEDKNADKLEALTIGMWDEEMGAGTDSQPIITFLVDSHAKLPNLKAFFLADVNSEECEMSWIENGDWSPLLKAFPKLEHVRIRGAGGSGKLESKSLRSLCLQCGVPSSGVQAVAKAKLPELEHLELWLGTPNYNGNSTVNDLMPILSGKLFPKLKYLGLRNAQIADEVAAAVAESPLVERLHTLDLSMGCLGDAGVEALVASPAVAKLQRLDVSHHYASDAVIKKLKKLGIPSLETKIGGAKDYREADWADGERYVSVGE